MQVAIGMLLGLCSVCRTLCVLCTTKGHILYTKEDCSANILGQSNNRIKKSWIGIASTEDETVLAKGGKYVLNLRVERVSRSPGLTCKMSNTAVKDESPSA